MIAAHIVLLCFFAIAFFIEAKHDFVISNLQQSIEENKKWHRLDWKYIAVIGTGMGLSAALFFMLEQNMEWYFAAWQGIDIALSIAVLKPLTFNIRINKLFGHNWNYVGQSGLESKFKGKENLYYGLCFFLLCLNIATIICINVLILK